MTLWAQRVQGSPDYIEVNGTSGSITVKVTEHYSHLRSFWGTLGSLLDAVETPEPVSEASE